MFYLLLSKSGDNPLCYGILSIGLILMGIAMFIDGIMSLGIFRDKSGKYTQFTRIANILLGIGSFISGVFMLTGEYSDIFHQ